VNNARGGAHRQRQHGGRIQQQQRQRRVGRARDFDRGSDVTADYAFPSARLCPLKISIGGMPPKLPSTPRHARHPRESMSISAQTLVGRRAPLDHDGEQDFHIGTSNGRPPAQPADASSSPRHALAGIHEYTAQTLVNGRGQLDRDGEYQLPRALREQAWRAPHEEARAATGSPNPGGPASYPAGVGRLSPRHTRCRPGWPRVVPNSNSRLASQSPAMTGRFFRTGRLNFSAQS
jgi:hypothetical protein